MLKAQGVKKTFFPGSVNEKRALRGVDLTLEDGDFATVIGSNGAGKSTFLNAIAGVFPIDSGTIEVGGVDLTGNFKTTSGNYFANLWAGVFTMGIVSALNPGTENEYIGMSTSASDPDNGAGIFDVMTFENGRKTIATRILGDTIKTGTVSTSGNSTVGGNVYVGGVLQLKNGQIRPGDGQNTLTVDWVRIQDARSGTDYWVLGSRA